MFVTCQKQRSVVHNIKNSYHYLKTNTRPDQPTQFSLIRTSKMVKVVYFELFLIKKNSDSIIISENEAITEK